MESRFAYLPMPVWCRRLEPNENQRWNVDCYRDTTETIVLHKKSKDHTTYNFSFFLLLSFYFLPRPHSRCRICFWWSGEKQRLIQMLIFCGWLLFLKAKLLISSHSHHRADCAACFDCVILLTPFDRQTESSVALSK